VAIVNERRGSSVVSRVAGVALLMSIVVWWIGLRAWAEAQVGYLDVDALGAAPFVWTALLAIAGLALVTRVFPRPSDTAANISATFFFLVVTGALAAVDIAYGAGDGISSAGWLMAALSVAQVVIFVAGVWGEHVNGRR
jgi:hypothetical protein